MSSDENLLSKGLSIVTLNFGNDFVDYLQSKAKYSTLSLWAREKIGIESINEEVRNLTSYAISKSKLAYKLPDNDIKELFEIPEFKKLIYNVLSLSDVKKAQTEINTFDLSATSFNLLKKRRAKKFINELARNLIEGSDQYLNVASRKIIQEVNDLKEIVIDTNKSVHQLSDRFNNFYAESESISSLINSKYEELDELDNSENYKKLREKALAFIDIERKLPNSNNEKLADIYLKLSQSYLSNQDPEEQQKAIQYFEEVLRLTNDQQKKSKSDIYIALINQELDEAEKKIDVALNKFPDENLFKNLKFQVLTFKKDFDSALDVADELDSKILKCIALQEKGDYQTALNIFFEIDQEKRLKHSNFIFYVETVTRMFSDVKNRSELTGENIKIIKKCIDSIDDHIKKLKHQLLDIQISDLLLRQSFLLHFLNNLPLCKSKLEEAYHLSPTNSNIIENLISISLEINDIDRAEELISNTKDDNLKFLYKLTALEIRLAKRIDLKETKREIKILIDDHSISIQDRAMAFLVHIRGLLDGIEITEAERQFENYISLLDSTAEFWLARANWAIKKSEHKIIIESYEQALNKAKDPRTKWKIKKQFAEYLFHNSKNETELSSSLNLFEQISNESIFDENLRKKLILLYRLKDKGRALKLCDHLINVVGFENEEILNLKAIILAEDENFTDAEPIFKKLVNLNNSNDQHLINLATAYARLDKDEKAKDLLIQLRGQLKDGDPAFILLSQISFSLKDYENSINDAYRAVNTNNPTLEASYYYFFTALNIPQKIDLSKVQQEALNQAKNRLVESDSEDFFVKEVSVDLDSPDKLHEQLLSEIPQFDLGRAFKDYNSFKLPVFYLRKLISRDYLSTLNIVLADDNFKIWTSSGKHEEYRFSETCLNNSKNVVLDLLPIFVLQKLSFLDKLKDLFNPIIHQNTLDELLVIKKELENTSIKGVTTLHQNGKNIGVTEVDKKYYKNEFDKLSQTIDYVKKNFKIIGNKPGSENIFDEEFYAKTIDVFGKPTLSSIRICSSYEYTFYSDEFTSRILANTYNIGSFDTVTLIRKFQEDGLITNEELQNALIELSNYNFYFLRINADTLIRSMRMQSYVRHHRTTAVFRFLNNHEITSDSLKKIGSSFLNRIWADPTIMEAHKISWSNLLMDNMTSNEGKSSAEIKDIVRFIKNTARPPSLIKYLMKY